LVAFGAAVVGEGAVPEADGDVLPVCGGVLGTDSVGLVACSGDPGAGGVEGAGA